MATKKTSGKTFKAKENINVSNCTFTTNVFDPDMVKTVQTVAEGLLNLTQLFKAQNVVIESMLRFDQSGKED